MKWAVGNMSSVNVTLWGILKATGATAVNVNYTKQWQVSLSQINTVISMEKISPNFEDRLLTIVMWFDMGSRLSSFSFIVFWKSCGSCRVRPDDCSAVMGRGMLLVISKNLKGMCDPKQMFTCILITDYKLVFSSVVIFKTRIQKNSLSFLIYSSTDCNPHADSYNHLHSEDAGQFHHRKTPLRLSAYSHTPPPSAPATAHLFFSTRSLSSEHVI